MDIEKIVSVPVFDDGPVAQLGERVLCKHEVSGSIPLRSTESAYVDSSRVASELKYMRRGAGTAVPRDRWKRIRVARDEISD